MSWLDDITRANAIRKWQSIIRNVAYSKRDRVSLVMVRLGDNWLTFTGMGLSGVILSDRNSVQATLNGFKLSATNSAVDRTQFPERVYTMQVFN